jgi:hypothetical protein
VPASFLIVEAVIFIVIGLTTITTITAAADGDDMKTQQLIRTFLQVDVRQCPIVRLDSELAYQANISICQQKWALSNSVTVLPILLFRFVYSRLQKTKHLG